MFEFDFSIDEICASIEAKDKTINAHFDKDKIKEIRYKLEAILRDFVDMSINSLRAAFIGLEDYIYLPEYERNNNLLMNIETNLNNNTGLKPELFTQGVSNYDILAYTYFVLYIINVIKGNSYMSVRYLLKIFVSNPRIARNDLAPSVYDDFFKPQLLDYYYSLLQYVPKDPRRTFKNNEIQSFLVMEHFEKSIIIHNDEFEKQIDKQCIMIAKKALGDYNLC